MPKISRRHGERRIWLWHPKKEPSIGNKSHPDIGNRLLYTATTSLEATCLSAPHQWPGFVTALQVRAFSAPESSITGLVLPVDGQAKIRSPGHSYTGVQLLVPWLDPSMLGLWGVHQVFMKSLQNCPTTTKKGLFSLLLAWFFNLHSIPSASTVVSIVPWVQPVLAFLQSGKNLLSPCLLESRQMLHLLF